MKTAVGLRVKQYRNIQARITYHNGYDVQNIVLYIPIRNYEPLSGGQSLVYDIMI